MPAPGDQLAHYRIEALLGAGGMGEVHVAFDQTLERRVALKLLPEARALHADARARMLREARAASALAHPGIVTVYEIGEVGGRTYIAMELVEGETLAQLLVRRGRLPLDEAVALLRQVGDTIAAAHAAGILHRDLKTANLMVDGAGRVKVLDFGLSKRVGAPSQPPSSPPRPRPRIDPEAETVAGDPAPIDERSESGGVGTPGAAPLGRGRSPRGIDPRGETVTPAMAETVASDDIGVAGTSGDVVTVHGARMGTPGSAAPELMDGEDADVRSDVFSLGVVLHELVTGKPPFPWTSWEDIRLRILEQRYRRASEVVGGAPGERLDAVIARALAPRREDRFAGVRELVAAAEALTRVRRRWPLYAGAGAGALVLAGGVAALAWSRSGATHAAPSIDAGPPGPVSSEATLEPGLLTRGGGCAYTPTFVDARTVVYDLTFTGGSPDLWSIAVTGGEAARLTDGPAWEWRATSGRAPGRAVFLLDDPEFAHGGEAFGIGEVELATRKIERLAGTLVASAAVVGGDVYYLLGGGAELRRLRGKIDELVAALPGDGRAEQLVASSDGRWVAIAGPPPATPLSVLEVASGRVTALPAAVPGNSRPAFSAITPSIYYLGAAGIRRIGIDGTGDELVGPKLRAAGGLAVSPDGAYLVYSECDQRSSLLDVTASPPVEVVHETYGAEPIAGPRGWLAWVSQSLDDAVLMVRRPDGTIEQLTSRTLGKVSSPAFDETGSSIAFAVSGGDHPGIQVMALTDDQGTRRVFGLSGSEGDTSPLYAGGDLIFTRFDPAGGPTVYRAPIGGGRIERAFEDPGIGFSVAGKGAVVIGVGPSHEFRMWDPGTGAFTRLTLPGELIGVPRFSPDGEWMVVHGRDTVWRLHLRAGASVSEAIPEKVFEVPPDGTAGFSTITDDGRVITAPALWAGELYVVPAPPNTRW